MASFQKGSGLLLSDFFVLQHFEVTCRPRLSDRITEVRWKLPDWGWIKVNTDGSSIGSSNIAAIGLIFRDHNAGFIGALAENIGYFNALFAEFFAVMFAIEKAHEMHWSKLWIENDSWVAVSAFNSEKVAVP